jgi:hypothetical protein
MPIEFERDDAGIRVHERGVIAQLCSLFRSHEQGMPEWFKNASTAYARDDTPTEFRVLTLFAGTQPGTSDQYLALLDHAGMSVEDLEQRFANWGDSEAHLSAETTEEALEGGHGNGGKCYMTQMFSRCSYIYTVRNGRGSRYGFIGDDPHPGYFPNRRDGRGFPVASPVDELRRALSDLGVDFARLPEEVRTAASAQQGFSMVVGIAPKHFRGKDAARLLLETIIHHPQMELTNQKNRIFVIIEGRQLVGSCPVRFPEIEPHEFAPEPKIISVPAMLEDPISGDMSSTKLRDGEALGQLILRTSRVSMRWKLKSRHHIRYIVDGRPVAFLRMENVSRSTWVDKMYGECKLNILGNFETPDRTSLAEAPLTRALEKWVKDQIFIYEADFRKRERLTASHEYRNKAKTLNDLLDRWKNNLLDEALFGAGGSGPGEGRRRTTRRRPLPQTLAVSVNVKTPYSKAGVGVWLRLGVEFRDAEGIPVAQPAFLWHSSDWAVATVDENRVVTHTPGIVEIWLETADARLRSTPVRVEVLDTASVRIEPVSIELQAGKVEGLTSIVRDRDGREHAHVFMTWLQDDSSIVHVTATGKVIAQKQGETNVYALDERCVNDAGACTVIVTPAEILAGKDPGHGYPKILLSEIDQDPLNPDGETVHLSPEDGPVHQPTPQHVEHNIWWINLQCPLAKLYFDIGPDSREWRSYHIERYIEALAKIRLSRDFQIADHDLSFDEVERRWREVAAEVQRRALEDLRPLLEGEEIEG